MSPAQNTWGGGPAADLELRGSCVHTPHARCSRATRHTHRLRGLTSHAHLSLPVRAPPLHGPVRPTARTAVELQLPRQLDVVRVGTVHIVVE
eukprot:3093531-Prymnesium_polylepis.1